MQKNVRFSIESEQINDQVRIQKYGRFDSVASCELFFSKLFFNIKITYGVET